MGGPELTATASHRITGRQLLHMEGITTAAVNGYHMPSPKTRASSLPVDSQFNFVEFHMGIAISKSIGAI